MKTAKFYSSLFSLIALFLLSNLAYSQYDDLYYDDSEDVTFEEVTEEYTEDYAEDNADYEYYNVDEEDGYYYSSRIRRFSRNNSSLGFYSPVYTNYGYYGAYNPTRYAGYNAFSSPYGYGRTIGYNSLLNPYSRSSFNRIGGINSGFGGYSAYGASALYCPPVGGLAVTPTTNRASTRNVSTQSSSRRSGSRVNSTPNRTERTRTVVTGRDYRTPSSTNTSVRTERTRVNRPTRTRTQSRSNTSYRAPRSTSRTNSSSRTYRPTSSSGISRSTSRSSSVRSSGSSSSRSSSRGSSRG